MSKPVLRQSKVFNLDMQNGPIYLKSFVKTGQTILFTLDVT